MNAITIFAPATLAALLFAGVALSGTTDTHPLAGTQWGLTMLEGTETPDGVISTLNFGEEGDIGGNGGCNVFGGTVDFADAGAIEISEIFSTMMACEDPKMSQERAFFAALEAAAHFTLENETLTLADKDGAALAVFTPASD